MKENDIKACKMSVEKTIYSAKKNKNNLYVVFGSLYMIWAFFKVKK